MPDPGNDTIACRSLNVSSAKDEVDPVAKHNDCVGAGIATNCVDPQCAAFCAADLALCGSSSPYKTTDECMTACAGWGKSFDGHLLNSTGNTLQCRTYHLELSQTGVASDLAAALAQQLELAREVARGDRRRGVPLLGVARDGGQDPLLADTADHDRRMGGLHRPRLAACARQLVVGALLRDDHLYDSVPIDGPVAHPLLQQRDLRLKALLVLRSNHRDVHFLYRVERFVHRS